MIYFHSIHDFFHMGGCAFYVWSAYGVTLFFLALNMWLPYRRRRRSILKLRQKYVS